jgi:hypothetical protein
MKAGWSKTGLVAAVMLLFTVSGGYALPGATLTANFVILFLNCWILAGVVNLLVARKNARSAWVPARIARVKPQTILRFQERSQTWR